MRLVNILLKLGLIALILWPVWGHAQTATQCSATTPCVQLTITNPNPLPSQTVLLTCMGPATAGSCSQADLTSYLSTQTATNLCPAVSSNWHCITFSQTKTPQLYNDLEAWGALMNYAVEGVTTGGVSAASPILIFPVPQAPVQVPSLGTPTPVISGTVGPQ